MSGADLVAAINFCTSKGDAASYRPQAGGLISSGPLGREVFTKTGNVVPVRTLTQETHCEKLPFNTGAERQTVTITIAGVDDPGDWRRRAPRPVAGPFLHTLWPVKKYVAVGGRNPRVLQLIFEFFFDSLYGSIVISGFIGLGDEMRFTEGRQNLNRLCRYCRLGGFSFGEVGP